MPQQHAQKHSAKEKVVKAYGPSQCPCKRKLLSFCSFYQGQLGSYRPPELITTLAPSFPNTPASRGLGLLALPPFRLKNPSIPVGLAALLPTPLTPSTGRVAFLSARWDHDAGSTGLTCRPPLFDALRVPPRCRCVPEGCPLPRSLVSLAGVTGGAVFAADFGRSGAEKYSDPGVSGPTGVSAVT